MKVLFTTNIPSPYRVEFFNELGKLCDLTVLFEREKAKDREATWLDNSITHFNAIFMKGIKFQNDSSLSLEVIKYLKNDIFDIIVIGGYATLTGILSVKYLKNNKIPFILNTDGGIIKADSMLKYRIKKYLISSASAWLSSGIETNKYLLHYGADKNRIFEYPFTSLKNRDILRHPVSLAKKKILRTELGVTEKLVILSVGQFIQRKGNDILLKAASTIDKNIGIYFIGGIATDEYNVLIKKYSLTNIHFVGFKSKEILNKYYEMSDLFVLPTRNDIWGLVINEAMAFGLPIITTDKCVAGLELVKNNENGFIVPVEDNGELSNKINAILNNEQIRANMSINNLLKIRKYTIENMAEEHMNVFLKFNNIIK